MFARQQAAALMEVKNQAESHGVTIVAIGSGTPEQARDFAEKFNFQGEIYLDQALRSYKAFKLERGFWRTLGPASLARGFKTLKQGFRQGRNAGDLWQQGGVFVIGPGNQIVFQHRNSGAGDQADLDAVIQACPIN
ncbi:MAG: AhpC/TSA family protein [Proteobacteria bacterium]|nr:AhpC/TSA family protein [Pseudomonadota bacterium]